MPIRFLIGRQVVFGHETPHDLIPAQDAAGAPVLDLAPLVAGQVMLIPFDLIEVRRIGGGVCGCRGRHRKSIGTAQQDQFPGPRIEIFIRRIERRKIASSRL